MSGVLESPGVIEVAEGVGVTEEVKTDVYQMNINYMMHVYKTQ